MRLPMTLACHLIKVFVNLDKYGNTSAASIPLALAGKQLNNKLVTSGQTLLISGFGAGLAWEPVFGDGNKPAFLPQTQLSFLGEHSHE